MKSQNSEKYLFQIIKSALLQIGKKEYFLYILICIMNPVLSLLFPILNGQIYDEVIPSNKFDRVAPVLIFMIAAVISSYLFAVYKHLLGKNILLNVYTHTHTHTFKRMVHLPLSYFHKNSGERIRGQLESVNDIVYNVAFNILYGISMVTTLILCSFQLSSFSEVLFIPALLICVFGFLFHCLVSYRKMKLTKRSDKIQTEADSKLIELYEGMERLKFKGVISTLISRWKDKNDKYIKLNYDPPFSVKYSFELITVFDIIGSIIIYILACNNSVEISSLAAFLSSFAVIKVAFKELGNITETVSEIFSDYKYAEDFIKSETETEDTAAAIKLRGHLQMEKVSFRYEKDGPLILNDINLEIEKNSYAAVIGTSGCGKSTLMKLFLRFFTATEGAVRIDGEPIGSYDSVGLHRRIGVVFQNGKIINGTVLENVSICTPNNDMKAARDALLRAGVREHTFENGFDTIISSKYEMSDAVKQCIMIARGIVNNPDILMLDEVSATLDKDAENEIARVIANQKCTKLVIAHRLATIKNCDKIFVMDKGKIMESGTFNELYERKGLLYELVNA